MLFLKKSFYSLILLFFTFVSYSQIRPSSSGSLYIGENGLFTIFGHHNFNTGTGFIKPGIISTDRSSNPGFLVYSSQSSWSGASEKQYIDGYVTSYHDNKFTFPIGHNGEYRPVCLSDSYASSVAYFNENPTQLKGTAKKSIFKVSEVEYWSIHLNQASHITLSWSSQSNIGDLLENNKLEQLTIVGLTADDEWEIIQSSTDENVLNVSLHKGDYNTYTKSKHSLGSITSDNKVKAGRYSQFTLASVANTNDFVASTMNIYPNPQLIGTKINIDYILGDANSGTIRIFKSDNSLLYEFEVSAKSEIIQLPYYIKESGSYILSLTDSKGKTTYENLIVVDN